MTVTTSKKDLHLAACAEAKVAGDARRSAAKKARAVAHGALIDRLKARGLQNKAVRLSRHHAANDNLRNDAAVTRLLADANKGVGLEALAAAFQTVCNPVDWRASVDRTLPGHVSDDLYDLTTAAIAFFTCCKRVEVGSIRDADGTNFNADGFDMNTHGDCAPASAEQIDQAISAARTHSLPTNPARDQAA